MADVQQEPVRKPPSADDPILAEIVKKIVEVYHPERVYVFGSAARGDARPWSDYDLMVVVPDDTPVEVLKSDRIYEILRAMRARATEVHLSTRHNFDKQLHLKASFPSTIVREGKLLYGA